MDAKYISVIKAIDVMIEAPAGRVPMQTEPDENTLRVIFADEYQIRPDFVEIAWSPKPSGEYGEWVADFLDHYPADAYMVVEDHVFTAQWEKDDTPSEPDAPSGSGDGASSDESKTIAPATGDPAGVLVLSLFALLGIAGGVLVRVRRRG